MSRRIATARTITSTVVFALGASLLATIALALTADPSPAAGESEAVTTLTRIMTNFDAQPAKRFTLTDPRGVVIERAWQHARRRNGYSIDYGEIDRSITRTVYTPHATYVKLPKSRCWWRSRSRFKAERFDFFSAIDTNTVERVASDSIRLLAHDEGLNVQLTVIYDTVTLLPTRFEINASDPENPQGTFELVQSFAYTTPSHPPKPRRICRAS